MKMIATKRVLLATLSYSAIAAILTGCGTTSDKPMKAASAPGQAGSFAKYYRTPDKRKICIGTYQPGDGGLVFKEPHVEKCWIASGFDFNGYTTLYIAPTMTTAKVREEDAVLESVVGDNLVATLKAMLDQKRIFANVMVEKPPANAALKILKLTNTVVDYSKGSYTGRYFAGLFGGGQPVFRVEGVATDGENAVFKYTIERHGTSFAARTDTPLLPTPSTITLEQIQQQDIYSMSLDLTDFMAAIAGKYAPVN